MINAAVLCFCACTDLEISRADAAIYRTNCQEKATAIILLSFIGSYVTIGPLWHERARLSAIFLESMKNYLSVYPCQECNTWR